MPGSPPLITVITGVAGCGKTTLGRLAARHRDCPFFDGDTFHDARARAKMSRGEGLNDADRIPWLGRIRERIESFLTAGAPAVFACSALKHKYRSLLARPGEPVQLVYLRISPELAGERLAGRKDHFAGPSLAASQFADLEEPGPGEALWLDASRPPETLLHDLMQKPEALHQPE